MRNCHQSVKFGPTYADYLQRNNQFLHMSNIDLAGTVMERIEALARISEELGKLTRTFCSPAMRQANKLVGSWMREAGMTVSEDAIGNLIGRYPSRGEGGKTFLLGSHLDTVRDAGKFDGPLGVLIAIACVQQLHQSQVQLPFSIEVIGFADEEGVRYQTTYLGSKVLAGKFNEHDLKRIDVQDVSMADAIKNFGGDPEKLQAARRDPQKLLGYAEVHIEQGPVLEKKYQPVGVVSAIAGQTRIKARFTGRAGHAGTTPMNLRQDALAAAAEFILAVESSARAQAGLVATVGQIETKPGASNVIPGEVNLSVDVRHQLDDTRTMAVAHLQDLAHQIGGKRSVTTDWEVVHEAPSVPCSRDLSDLLSKAARQHLVEVTELPSGAGHDAAMMGDITPVAMLFVRCKGGISHHPDESVEMDDVRVAIAVMNDFLLSLGNRNTQFFNKKNI
jgi:allantoate deiminase